MTALQIITLCLIAAVVSCFDVKGFVGGTVKIKCKYDIGYSSYNKYFCKGQNPGCEDLVKTSALQPLHDRFSLNDSRIGHFTVQITNLSLQDSGMYQCAVDIPVLTDDYTEINLHVEDKASDLRKTCKESDVACILKFLNEMDQEAYETATLPLKEVSSLLDVLLEAPQESLASRGEDVLQSTEKLVSRLVEPTHTQSRRNLSTNTTEVGILSIGTNTTLTTLRPLVTTNVSLDIDLLGIAQNNNGAASVVFMVYKDMQEVLNASFFNAGHGHDTSAMSNVVSVVLPHILNKTLLSPVNLTIHLRRTRPKDKLSCVFWNVSAWIEDGCHVSESNSTHTVCSCQHLSTFALIMTVDHTLERHPVVDVLNTILVLVGLVFLALAVITFALCRWNPRVSNVARLNLCVCLLLAQPLFLLTQSFVHLIWPHEVLCKLLSGVLHFLFLCCFVWMSIEAVLLFLSVRKLKQVKPNERAGLHWKLSILIGYGIPLVIVGVSAGVRPDGYGSEECWLKTEDGFNWSFLGPVSFILVGNIILFLIILITIYSTLKEARSDASTVKCNRVLLFKIMMQFIIFGCPWILGLLVSYSQVLEVLFLFLTSQQGTAIFVIHCLLNTEVRTQYRTWWKRFGPAGKPTPGSCSGTSVSVDPKQEQQQQAGGDTVSSTPSVTLTTLTSLRPATDGTVSWDKLD